ncbi:TIM23 complex component [Mortierella polycephala]|uniref:Presequence translocated-associated motor subunit PAM17 n=1 Tax=Mortierella polycephala TaxID=41804 RepID=A0A9P6PPT1_9FUNG|nr:TIM23 complex component [Mortierella polycephala]
MSLLTGRMAPRACIFRSTCKTVSSRRLLTTSAPLRNAQSSASNSAKAVEQQAKHETMDWNTYFAFRRTRRNYERVFMVPCALFGLGGAGYFFAQQDFDPTPIFGMDQVVVYGVGTIAAGIIGLATGPVVGNMIFRTVNSKAKPLVDRDSLVQGFNSKNILAIFCLFAQMDKEFFKHIVKNRADPTANSVRNPIPDYYGEKIKSVSEYRAWLRKQREYRRKSQFYVGVD